MKVTPKEVTGNDYAVHAVISEPIDVAVYGAVKTPRMKIRTAGSVSQKIGFYLAYRASARARQGFPDRLLEYHFRADAPFVYTCIASLLAHRREAIGSPATKPIRGNRAFRPGATGNQTEPNEKM